MIRRPYLQTFLWAALALPAAAQTPADFYDSAATQDLRIELHPKDWAALRENYWSNDYYPANFHWRNITVENIGVRSRGRGSRSPWKPNLRIDFDRYESSQKFLGLKSAMLKANNQDPSMMRERIAMTLFESMGIPAPRETYARLFVNGEYFGLYNLIESIDKDFLRRVYGEDAGFLYEWQPTNDQYHFEYLGDDPALYSPLMFDPKTHEKDPNPAPLVDMIRAINESSEGEFVQAISNYIDPEQFVRHLAVESFLAEFDGILGDTFGMNNFYVYRFAGTTRHVFLPWDKDGTFSQPERDVMQGVYPNVLARRLLSRPAFQRLYQESLLKAAEVMGSSGGAMEKLINQFYGQIAVDARVDPNKQCSMGGVQYACGAAEFEAGVAYLHSFARTRASFVALKVYEQGYIPAE